MNSFYKIIAKNPTRITNTIQIGTVSHADAISTFLENVREWLSNDVSGHVIHWADADQDKPDYYCGAGYYDADADRCILLDSENETTTVECPGETYVLTEQSHYAIAADLVRNADSDDIHERLDDIHDSCTDAIWVYDTETCEFDYIGLQSGSVLHPDCADRYIVLHTMKASKHDDGLYWNEDLFTDAEVDIILDEYDDDYQAYLAAHPETDSYEDRCANARKWYWNENWSEIRDTILDSLESESE